MHVDTHERRRTLTHARRLDRNLGRRGEPTGLRYESGRFRVMTRASSGTHSGLARCEQSEPITFLPPLGLNQIEIRFFLDPSEGRVQSGVWRHTTKDDDLQKSSIRHRTNIQNVIFALTRAAGHAADSERYVH